MQQIEEKTDIFDRLCELRSLISKGISFQENVFGHPLLMYHDEDRQAAFSAIKVTLKEMKRSLQSYRRIGFPNGYDVTMIPDKMLPRLKHYLQKLTDWIRLHENKLAFEEKTVLKDLVKPENLKTLLLKHPDKLNITTVWASLY